MHVQIDGKQVSPPEGYLIRKGPGNCYFDFAQEIVFASQQKSPMPTTVQTKMESSVRSVMCTSPRRSYCCLHISKGMLDLYLEFLNWQKYMQCTGIHF